MSESKAQDDLVIYLDRGLSKNAELIHGVNPVLLFEKIIRERILDTIYWKLNCFGLTPLTILDKAVKIKIIGGQDSNQRPSHFQCLLLKLLQIHPSKEIISEYINQKRFKYLTCLGLMYARLCFDSIDVYETLETYYNDYRKVRFRPNHGSPVMLYHIDEFVDELLTKERVCDLILPRLPNREFLEDEKDLEPRKSTVELNIESESEPGSGSGSE
ncbi:U4/U6-U5 snRNP complex subunit PRP38 [Ascoidea rubescens DSM 1968]|uniref:Pre-mRNA-splicing factor 38 n=1 Tax=Ascoidea rubescens DSM 1968 TaxID=1344418 RepID=A0A1D2VQ78_9ASCO|nr:PRP38-domain-containing protein [Ascoidea rubescens DSM 1968]ODV63773.1 PRP38-domain-containing protein [Ascoidea rubescens DSM 1968]